MTVMGRYSEFIKTLPEGWAGENSVKDEAVQVYLSSGGVLKVDKKGSLVYPSSARIESQIDSIQRKRTYIESQLEYWEKELTDTDHSSFTDKLGKFIDPLYWHHRIKFAIDRDYKEAMGIVEPPVDYMHEDKWRRMMKMFVSSKEYRDRLIEARTSDLGKKRDSITESVGKGIEFKREVIQSRIGKLLEDKGLFEDKERALRVLHAWSQE